MRAIFGALVSPDDASVAVLLDAQRAVVASSDPYQVPVGTVLGSVSARSRTLRFGGREYLAAQTRAAGYQGYRGPGWDGCVLVPVDLAFRADLSAQDAPALADARVAGSHLFGAELQSIPAQARNIQRGLERLVWNGQLRIRREQDGAALDTRFAGALLARVTGTGQRISAVFERAIGDLQRAAVTSVLEEVRACSALGIDILDRSLYERANDCRWWALDRSLQQVARAASTAGAAGTSAEAAAVLRHIHGLYTVYSELLLLDARGRVLATSTGTPGAATVDAPWLPSALALRGDQAFVRSVFAASPLYDGRHTYVFAAPVSGDSGNAGCVAIVFDSEAQIEAMLRDTLPVDGEGLPLAQASGLFVTRSGTVVASTHAVWKTGGAVPFADRLASLARGASSGLLLDIDGVPHVAGITMSGGYREYESTAACGPEDVACVMLIAVDAEGTQATGPSVERFAPPRTPPTAPGPDRVVLASLRVGDQWLGLPASQVIEAVAASTSGGTPGIVMHQGKPLAVRDIHQLRGERTHAGAARGGDGLLVVCEDAAGQRFALRVDEVGTVFDVPRDALRELPPGVAAHDPIATAVVRGDDASDRHLLTVIRLDTSAASGARNAP
jgi:chemotaxis signal transduction protein